MVRWYKYYTNKAHEAALSGDNIRALAFLERAEVHADTESKQFHIHAWAGQLKNNERERQATRPANGGEG